MLECSTCNEFLWLQYALIIAYKRKYWYHRNVKEHLQNYSSHLERNEMMLPYLKVSIIHSVLYYNRTWRHGSNHCSQFVGMGGGRIWGKITSTSDCFIVLRTASRMRVGHLCRNWLTDFSFPFLFSFNTWQRCVSLNVEEPSAEFATRDRRKALYSWSA